MVIEEWGRPTGRLVRPDFRKQHRQPSDNSAEWVTISLRGGLEFYGPFEHVGRRG
jgi:hypothetical protein